MLNSSPLLETLQIVLTVFYDCNVDWSRASHYLNRFTSHSGEIAAAYIELIELLETTPTVLQGRECELINDLLGEHSRNIMPKVRIFKGVYWKSTSCLVLQPASLQRLTPLERSLGPFISSSSHFSSHR